MIMITISHTQCCSVRDCADVVPLCALPQALTMALYDRFHFSSSVAAATIEVLPDPQNDDSVEFSNLQLENSKLEI